MDFELGAGIFDALRHEAEAKIVGVRTVHGTAILPFSLKEALADPVGQTLKGAKGEFSC